jgi:superoxide dismutase, Cu-Zn family
MRTPILTMGGALALAGVGALALAGCVGPPAAMNTDSRSGATADLRSVDGSRRGTATLATTGGLMRLTVEGVGLTPGAHGLHVHTVGKCDAPDFTTAGDHWNPTAKMHGRDNPMGAHSGDMPNLMIGTDGRGSIAFDLPGDMASLMDIDGAAIVVHAAPDDYKTDPSGNSGGRIACGVFG